MMDTWEFLSPIFFDLKMINVLTILRNFYPVVENGVVTCSSNNKLKLPFRKTKLGIQVLSYLGPHAWNSLPDNLKSATSVNSFKHYINEYFFKKLVNFEANIYSYT